LFKHSCLNTNQMFDHILPHVLKFTREKIEEVTEGNYNGWIIGIAHNTTVIEDRENGYYSWPCIANTTAITLVSEYEKKGIKKGECARGGFSVYLKREG
jgi:hypothetical protein